MNERTNDYFLNLMYNPSFLPGDFQLVGVTAANTSINDRSFYKKLDSVQKNELFQTNGQFDERKFNSFYDLAHVGYELLSNSQSNERLANSFSVFRNDVFAKSGRREQGAETYITKIPNPNQQSVGFIGINRLSEPTHSSREIAQSKLTWDGNTNSWIESPNDLGILDNFKNPKVMAQYDTDIDINGFTPDNPNFDKNNIQFHKGLKKINPITGTYYYETLNGRSIYGRDVLSGWDTLTKDGSFFNKYDFFDSDDLKKSGKGSLVKAAVKIAPALIPPISPWYIAARVGLELSDLAAKVGKFFIGDNPTLNHIEAFNAASTMSTSDWARGSSEMGIAAHPWLFENLINTAADVFTQLAEQRWMFTHFPSLIKGNTLSFDKEAQEAFKRKAAEDIISRYATKGTSTMGTLSSFEKAIDIREVAVREAQSMLEKLLKSAADLGKYLSKSYMVGITVADSYGEALEAGLSNTEAAIFTTVYGLAEYALLSTNLGEHILPELRANKTKWANIYKSLRTMEKETPVTDTRKWYKKVADFARQVAYGDFNDSKIARAYATNNKYKALALSVGSNALGEGLEEASEELLLDLSKSLWNVASELGMTRTGKTLQAFDGGNLEAVFNRYALNFVGGLMGGGIAVALPGFQQGLKNMLGIGMDRRLAYQELVAIIRNGEKEDFLKTIDKLEINDRNLSAVNSEIIDGKPHPKPLTSDSTDISLDAQNKQVMHQMVDMIDQFLTSSGAKVDDGSIMRELTGARDIAKFLALFGNDASEGSVILASYLQGFNTLATGIANLNAEINSLENPTTDVKSEASKLVEANADQIKLKKLELAELVKQRDMYLNGEMTKVVRPMILLELSPFLTEHYLTSNFKQYVESVEHRPLTEISDDRLQDLKKQWELIKSTELSDNIRAFYPYFMEVQTRLGEKMKSFVDSFINPNYQKLVGQALANTETGIFNQPDASPEDIQTNTQDFVQTVGLSNNLTLQGKVQAMDILMGKVAEKLGDDEKFSALQLLFKDVATLPDNANLILETFNGDAGKALEYIQQINGGIRFLKSKSDEVNTAGLDLDIKQIRERNVSAIFKQLLYNYSDQVREVLEDIPYVNNLTRDNLKLFFHTILNGTQLDGTAADDGYFEEALIPDTEAARSEELYKQYARIIDGKPYSPIELLADEFQLVTGNNALKVSEVIAQTSRLLNKAANEQQIETFEASDFEEQIKNALLVINLLSSHILASRNDGAKLGNVFGFASTINELNPDAKIVEFDNQTAQVLMHDLSLLKSRLEFILNVYNINSGQKLLENKKILTRVQTAFINRTKTLVGAFPDDWNSTGKVDELSAMLAKAVTFAKINENDKSDKYTLNLEDTIALEREYIQIQDAIFNIFEENKDKIDNGGLVSIISKFKLLPSSSEYSKNARGTLVDSNLEDFDDRSYIKMLASVAAQRSSYFYAEYKNIIGGRFAPIPGLELAVKMAYAFLNNRPMFERFAQAYNEVLLEQTSKLTDEEVSFYYDNYNLSIRPDALLDQDLAISFFHTFLAEGIPGAGKTTGFETVLLAMLNEYHKELLKNVWLVHTTNSKALAWAKALNLTEGSYKAFSKEEYLKHVFPDYVPHTYKDGIIQLELSDLIKDEETGLYQFKNLEPASDLQYPTLILMDEVTRFSQQELLASEKFQDIAGVSAIATGDFDQLGAIGSADESDTISINFNIFSGNFMGSPKIGTSMRTLNKTKDINLAVFREHKLRVLLTLRLGNPVEDDLYTQLMYVESEDPKDKNYGLFGEKIVNKDIDLIKKDVLLMLNTLKPNTQILYIYDDTSSEVYKLLEDLNTNHEAYKGKINFVSTSVAQGEEDQYYIVDLKTRDIGKRTAENNGNHEYFLDVFYTAISRSGLGTLIINNPNVVSVAASTKMSSVIKSPLSEQAIAEYQNFRKQVLEESNKDVPAGKTTFTNTWKKTKKTEDEGDTGEGSSGTNPDKDLNDNNQDSTTESNSRVLPLDNTKSTLYNMLLHSMPVSETGFVQKTEADGTTKFYTVEKDDIPTHKLRIDSLHGITQLGLILRTDADGNKKGIINKAAKATFDLTPDSSGSLRFKSEASEASSLDALNDVRQAGLNLRSKDAIKAQVKEALGLELADDEFGVDFCFISNTALDPNDDRYDYDALRKQKTLGGFGRLFKSIREKMVGIFRGEKTPPDIEEARLNKYFAMAVYYVDNVTDKKTGNVTQKRKYALTVPLAIFTNPMTMLQTDGFQALKTKFESVEIGTDTRKMEEWIVSNNIINDANYPNAQKLLWSLMVWNYKNTVVNNPNGGDVVVWMDDDFVLADKATARTGPVITVKKTRGKKGVLGHPYYSKGEEYYHDNTFLYAGEYVDLNTVDQSVHHISKGVYVNADPNLDIKRADGTVAIPRGHAFVLVSDYYKDKTDEELFDLYFLGNPDTGQPSELDADAPGLITAIMVSSPRINFEDYFKNFALKYKSALDDENASGPDVNIGNLMTDFRIAQAITAKDSAFDKRMHEIATKASSPDKNLEDLAILERWENFATFITLLGEKLEELKDPKKLVRYLQTKLGSPEGEEYRKLLALVKTPKGNKAVNGPYIAKNNTHTVKQFISNMLFYFVLKVDDSGIPTTVKWDAGGKLVTTESIQHAIKAVVNSIDNEEFKKGVYVNAKIAQVAYQAGNINIAAVETDNNYHLLYTSNDTGDTIDYGVFQINGKIDSTMLVLDVSDIMKKITSVMSLPLGTGEKHSGVMRLLHGITHTTTKRVTTSAPPKLPKEISDKFSVGSLNKLKGLWKALLHKTLTADSTEEEIINKLKELNYGVVRGDSNLFMLMEFKNEQLYIPFTAIVKNDNVYYVKDNSGTLTKISDLAALDEALKYLTDAEKTTYKENIDRIIETLPPPEDSGNGESETPEQIIARMTNNLLISLTYRTLAESVVKDYIEEELNRLIASGELTEKDRDAKYAELLNSMTVEMFISDPINDPELKKCKTLQELLETYLKNRVLNISKNDILTIVNSGDAFSASWETDIEKLKC